MPWWKQPTTHAAALVGSGFALTVLIAFLGTRAEGAEIPVALLLTLLAGLLQVLGASKFHSVGRADPGLARASVRRLIGMASRASHARTRAESCYESGTPTDAKRLMGVLSAELSFIEEGSVQAIEDWREFHDAALSEITELPNGR